MTFEQWMSVATTVGAILGSAGALIYQLRQLTIRIDGRMTELLELTRAAAQATGELVGRDTQIATQTALIAATDAERAP